MRLLLLRDINDQLWLIPFILLVVLVVLLVVICVHMLPFFLDDLILFIPCIFTVVVNMLGGNFPTSTFYRTKFVDTYYLSLVFAGGAPSAPSASSL